MPWIPLAAAALSAGASIYSSNKASQAAGSAAQKSQVDIDALNEQTKRIAAQNAIDSANLEKRLTPEVPALRTAANQGVLAGLTPSGDYQKQAQLLQQLLAGQQTNRPFQTVDQPGSLNTPVLQAAIDRAGQDLALGGKIPLDVQNLVTRGALSQGGSVAGPGGGLGLGRDLVARDLGTTSLNLLQQRLQNATTAGQLEQSRGLAGLQFATGRLQNQLAQNDQTFNQNQTGIGNSMNLVSLLQQMNQAQYGRNLAAAQYGQSIAQPNVGLNPGSIANITVGNQNNQGAAASNQADIYGRQSQNYANLGGQLLGYGLLQQNNYQPNNSFNSTYGSPTQTGNYWGNYNPPGK